jgi:hypothetical protein
MNFAQESSMLTLDPAVHNGLFRRPEVRVFRVSA